MSRPIDEKLVVMKMNNEDFKKKASETTSIFGKLKQSLSDIGDTKFGSKIVSNFSNIQASANKVDMSSISRSLDTISGRFTTLGVVATTALANITTQAMATGQAMLKSVSTAPIASGFNEYELKMKSIGTMLSNTEWEGKTLDDVKKNLAELNDYADNTIYSFAEMTSSIGRFTAAGVGLDDSTIAIKGLGNLAASSGASVEQLNTAMYQVSQGLAAGRFGLEDWNSMVNAGMGGKKTQDALMATAKAMGKNIDLSDGFRLSLQQGWLTSEVFLETLKKFGNDESMTKAATSVRTFTGMMDALKESVGSSWATTWEIVFGDFEDATVFWTGISETIGGFFKAQGDARNNMLRAVFGDTALLGLLDRVKGVFTPIGQIFGAVGDAFKSVFTFDPASIRSMIDGFANLADRMNISEKSISNIKTIFEGLFSVLDIGIESFKIFIAAIAQLLPGVGAIGEGLLTLLAHIFKIPIAIRDAIQSNSELTKSGGALGSVFSTLSNVIESVVDGLGYLGSVAKQAFSILFSGDYSSGPLSSDSGFVKVLEGISGAFRSFYDSVTSISLSAVGAGIVSFFTSIKDAIGNIPETISSIIEWFKGLWDLVANNQGWILAGGGIAGIAAVLWKLWETFEAVTKPLSGFGDILENAGDALGAFTLGIHVKSLLTVAIAVGLLAGSFLLLSNLNSAQITNGLYMIVGSLSAMVGALFLLSKYDITGSFGATMAIIGMSVAIGILAVAVSSMSNMNWEEMTKGIVGLVAILGSLTGAVVLMSKYGNSMGPSAVQFLAIAGAMGILVLVVKELGKMDSGEIIKSVATIGVLLTQLGLFVAIASRSGQFTASAAGILATAGAIWILVEAMEKIADIPVGDIVKGLTTIGIFLGGIAAFSAVTSDKAMLSIGTSLLLMAGALTALIIPIKTLGSMDLETLAKGIGSIAVVLGTLAIATKLMTGSIAGAIAMTIIAGALNLLVPPIALLGAMSWEAILKGVGGLAIALAAIGGVGIVLGMATPALVGFGLAVAAIGAGIGLAGIGMGAFAKGLLVLSTLTAASVAAILATLGAFLTGAVALIPAFTDLVSKAVLGMLDKLTEMAPKILDAMYNLGTALIEKVQERFPEFRELVTEFIVMLVEGFGEHSSKVLDAVTDLIVKMITKFGENATEFFNAGAETLDKFLDGMEEKIPEVNNRMVDFIINLVTDMATTVEQKGPLIITAFLDLMGEIIKLMITSGLSVVNALFGWIPGVTEATTAIGQNAHKYIDENFKALELGTEKGEDFAASLGGTNPLAEAAGKGLANSGVTGAKSVDASPAGKWFGEGFISGMSSGTILGRVASAAKNLATKAYNAMKEKLDINSPSEETKELGIWTVIGFATGMESSVRQVEISANAIPNIVMEQGEKAVTEGEKAGLETGSTTIKAITEGITKEKSKEEKKMETQVKQIATAVKKAFKDEMDEADYALEMGEIDRDGYIATIEAIKKKYAEYPELVREANLEILKIEEDIAKERAEARQQEFNQFKSDIEAKKYYNELSLAEELKIWGVAQAYYAKGTEERKQADREVYRLKNEINNKLLDLNETYTSKIQETLDKETQAIQEAEDAYATSFANRVSELSNFAGIFDEVTKDSEITGVQLLANLQSQYVTLEQWTKDIQALAARGLDGALLGTLQEMGPSAASEISALNTLTDSQLAEYANIWKSKNELARTQATAELETLRQETDAKILEIRTDSETQLEMYKNEWLRKIEEIKHGTTEQFVSLNSDMNVIAKNAMDGLKMGLESKRHEVMGVANDIAQAIIDTINSAMQINSPSRVLTRSGEWAGIGLANGLENSIPTVTRSSYGLADAVTSTLDNVLNDTIVPEIDTELKVRAIVEYEPIDTSSLNPKVSIQPDLSNSVNAMRAISNVKGQNSDNNPTSKEVKTEKVVNIEQKLEFHTKEMSPSEVARKNLQTSRELALNI